MTKRRTKTLTKQSETTLDDWDAEKVVENKLTDKERVMAELERERSRLKAKEHDSLVKALRSELMLAEKRLNAVIDITNTDIKPVIIKPTSKGLKDAIPVFCLSDLHIEERVDSDQVNGLNSYDPTIATARLKQYFESVLWLLEGHRKMANIDKIVLWIGGDTLTGFIHDEFKESNWLHPVEAILLLQDLLCSGIDLLLKHGGVNEIIIPCNFGNHGRTNPEKTIATAAKNSFEWLMYHNLAGYYKNNPKVRFNIANSYHLYMDIYDTVVRFGHGDHIKYGGGIGGLTIPINKKIAAWNTSRHADIDVMGHFHQLTNHRHFIVNGSLIGINAYALSIGATFEPPQQAFFMIRPERGMSAFAPIYVT